MPQPRAPIFSGAPHQLTSPPGDWPPSHRAALGPPGFHAVERVGISARRRDCSGFGQPAWARRLAGRSVGTFRAACPALSASSRCLGRLRWERLGAPAGRGLGKAGKVTSSVASPGPLCWASEAQVCPEGYFGAALPIAERYTPKTSCHIHNVAKQGVWWRIPLPRTLQKRFMT